MAEKKKKKSLVKIGKDLEELVDELVRQETQLIGEPVGAGERIPEALSAAELREQVTGVSDILRGTPFDILPGLEEELKGGFLQRLFNPRIGGEFGPRLSAVLPFGGATTSPKEDTLINEVIRQRNRQRLIEAGIPQEEFRLFGF